MWNSQKLQMIHPAGFCAALAMAFAMGVSAQADGPAVDKSGYWLFNPTPTEVMREFVPDRPNRTEGPFTVDAGHFQVESDWVTYTHDRAADGTERHDFTFLVPNLKLGLTDRLDFEAIIPVHQVQLSSLSGVTERHSGFGDVTLRAKWNFAGNDGGVVAFALLPFVKFPTAVMGIGNDRVEGGIIFPVQINLPQDFGLSLMAELDRNLNADGAGYHAEWITSVSLGHSIVGKLEGYVELYNLATAEDGSAGSATFDAGLLYHLSGAWILDAGVNLGLTPRADDFNPFVGISFRR